MRSTTRSSVTFTVIRVGAGFRICAGLCFFAGAGFWMGAGLGKGVVFCRFSEGCAFSSDFPMSANDAEYIPDAINHINFCVLVMIKSLPHKAYE
jgi:hypothetical protein